MNNATTAHLDLNMKGGKTNEAFADLFPNGDDTSFAMDFTEENQWDHFLAYSDAQNWADAQWQGLV